MFGILEATIYFWISFSVLHLLACFYLTVQVYYLGYWKMDRGVVSRVFNSCLGDCRVGIVNALTPTYKGRMVLLVIANACNWALAVLGVYHHERDFAIYLLAIFMSNTALYFIFYVVMKLMHKERINTQAVIFLMLSLSCAVAAMYFFLHKSISWAVSVLVPITIHLNNPFVSSY